uniref:Uncharacterized protein n=1 Tax=Rhizophora mucronata TaxID=61149 RepID=A0A2P2P5P6_RHIMU
MVTLTLLFLSCSFANTLENDLAFLIVL